LLEIPHCSNSFLAALEPIDISFETACEALLDSFVRMVGVEGEKGEVRAFQGSAQSLGAYFGGISGAGITMRYKRMFERASKSRRLKGSFVIKFVIDRQTNFCYVPFKSKVLKNNFLSLHFSYH